MEKVWGAAYRLLISHARLWISLGRLRISLRRLRISLPCAFFLPFFFSWLVSCFLGVVVCGLALCFFSALGGRLRISPLLFFGFGLPWASVGFFKLS